MDEWGLIWDEDLGRKEDVETGRKREEQGKTRDGAEQEEKEMYSQKNLKNKSSKFLKKQITCCSIHPLRLCFLLFQQSI